MIKILNFKYFNCETLNSKLVYKKKKKFLICSYTKYNCYCIDNDIMVVDTNFR